MQKGNDPGKFRQLDEIIYGPGYPGYQSLSSMADNTMQVVCDVKGIFFIFIFASVTVEMLYIQYRGTHIKL